LSIPKIVKSEYEEGSNTLSKFNRMNYLGASHITGKQEWLDIRKKSYQNISKLIIYYPVGTNETTEKYEENEEEEKVDVAEELGYKFWINAFDYVRTHSLYYRTDRIVTLLK
jgi:MoaA/NifB/PqqE/SkfB family radical SAM enzyme